MNGSTIGQKGSAILWVVQVLLAALFLFAGGTKLALPIASLQGPLLLPGAFIRFIGVAEVLGALGLVLPGLLRVGKGATPLAGVGLVTIMAGATALTVEAGMVGPAVIPLVVGLLAAAVVLGRADWAGALASLRA